MITDKLVEVFVDTIVDKYNGKKFTDLSNLCQTGAVILLGSQELSIRYCLENIREIFAKFPEISCRIINRQIGPVAITEAGTKADVCVKFYIGTHNEEQHRFEWRSFNFSLVYDGDWLRIAGLTMVPTCPRY